MIPEADAGNEKSRGNSANVLIDDGKSSDHQSVNSDDIREEAQKVLATYYERMNKIGKS